MSRQKGKSYLTKWIKENAEKVGEGQYKVGSVIVWIPTDEQVKRHQELTILEDQLKYFDIPPVEKF